MSSHVQLVQRPKKAHQISFIMTERQDSILHTLYQFRYLTAEQITRLFYSKGSLTYVRANLTALTDHDYLYRFKQPTINGTSPYIYTLGSRAIKYLKSLELEAVVRFRSKESELSYQHITHTLALNDVLIAASLLPRFESGLTLYDVRHEWFLKHTPLTVKITNQTATGKKEETITVVPDAFLDFRFEVNGRKQSMPIWLELDRGTEAIKQYKRKIRGLITAVNSSQYEALFSTKAVTIAFATTANGTRLANMRSWVKQELADLGKQAESSLFLFTKVPEGEVDPKTLFLAPTWYLSDDDSPLALVDMT